MLARHVLVVLALAATLGMSAGSAFAAEGPFRDLEPAAQHSLPARAAAGEIPLPRRFRALEVDVQALRDLLGRAPAERSSGASPLLLALPYPDGTDRLFRVEESPILEPALAAKFPEIHTFVAQGIDDPTATARLSLTSLGFHAMVLSAAGTVYIDPYHKGDSRYALSYFKTDAVRAAGAPFHCDVKGDVKGEDPEEAEAARRESPISLPATASGTQLRTYRLALAATGEYSAAVCAPDPAGVDCAMNAMVVSMNRVDGIYEREVAIRMVLVGNDDLIVYTDGTTDPYTNDDGGTMLGQNQTNLNNVIGSANYDIGHVFSTGGGGIAQLSVPCTGAKAEGVTGSGNPTGDGFDVDYVAHEMGHQFGADHTFNGTTQSCGGGNRSSSAAYEPGSGTTIMAYAGICGAEDLQPHSDDTFHTKSFDQIVAFSTGATGRSCAVATATGNTAPVVSAGAVHTIPKQTPFTLTGSATDADGDPLTYLWEEFDLGTAAPPNTDVSAIRPIFRTFVPLTVPSRTFPRLADLLANTPTLGESMPTRNRTMTFRLTARDNRAGGGGVNYASTTVTVNAAAGPFAITQPTTPLSWSGNSVQTVTWNVAGTSAAPVSCASVEIDLSTDGGTTFPTMLLAATPNDGAETVTVPNTPTAQARVRVACVGNVFFDVSHANFTIVADDGLPAPMLTAVSPSSGPITGGTAVTLTGTGFLSGATVLFGTTVASSVTVLGATSLTALTPVQAAGTVAVTITNPDAKSATLPSAFQFFDHSGMLIFKDGVESGDFSLWGGITP
jgi:Metallo-peptidase family M12B Reprolysin-like/IPT/TIG domain